MQKINLGAFSKETQYLIIAISILVVVYFGRSLLVPMSYGLLIAMVLYPVCFRLEKRGWPRSVAIAFGLTIVILIFLALIGLLVLQASYFLKDAQDLMDKLKPALNQLQHSTEASFHLPQASDNDWWQQLTDTLNMAAKNMAERLVSSGSQTGLSVFLVPVFAALFLYNRHNFVEFLRSIISPKYKEKLPQILNEVIHTYYDFIRGMIKVYIIVGILNSIGLLALGIRHAILFGMLTAIMTIIPYVGIIVSALLPISVALLTKDSIWYPIGVVGVFAFVQYLEANVIFPRMVAFQLKVSTWATLVAILAGGLLWGISGMILFIPFIGITKLVLDYIPEWEPLKILIRR
ncbi:AI-2E family transporter [Pseudoflavitalea rhizosphaerae]|uniref:AI-2E family transporter n=1 Tax=Pseudoflavitalea rhizosphaerae TaxID=1884793 RepID=UPI001F498964|nr:AI-2E family transporter [Pseudoflavitalea rhizosphaerae]